jgi:hypothetical protein
MNINTACKILGIDHGDWGEYFHHIKSYVHAVEMMEEFKSCILKSSYRQACMKHHPDHGGDEEQFKSVQAAYNFLMSMEIRRPQPVKVNYFYSRNVYSSWSSWTSSTCSVS